MRKAALPVALVAALLAAGCYTDSAGNRVFGRRPKGPTQQQLADQRRDAQIAQTGSSVSSMQTELNGLGTSMSTVSARVDDLAQANDARSADLVAMRQELAVLARRVEALEAKMNNVPSTINTALAAEHKAIVGEVNRAIKESDERTNRAIRDAVSKSRTSGGSSSGRSSAGRGTSPTGEYYEHVVESGQTISHIAQAYGVTSADIIRENNISDPAKIRVGQKLYIPKK